MSARATILGLLAALAAFGCAPREAYWRPAEGQAIGRDGLVGVRLRVPPDAPDAEGTAVAALSPLVRSERYAGRANLGAVIEFRNKRREPVTFLPDSVRLATVRGESFRPAAVTRGGRPADGPAEVPYWHEAAFVMRFNLDAGTAFETRTWLLNWSYRIGDEEYPQSTRFTATGEGLARRSLSGEGAGLTAGESNYRASGVPLLMDLPFLGVLFRSTSSSSFRSSVNLGSGTSSGGDIPGQWWPLE
jgi:hypothetical protein